MIAQDDVFATWVKKFQKLNSKYNTKSTRKIKHSLHEKVGGYIGIKGDGGVKSKGTIKASD